MTHRRGGSQERLPGGKDRFAESWRITRSWKNSKSRGPGSEVRPRASWGLGCPVQESRGCVWGKKGQCTSLERPSRAGYKGPESMKSRVFWSRLRFNVVAPRPLTKANNYDIGHFLSYMLMADIVKVREGVCVPGSDGMNHGRWQKGSHRSFTVPSRKGTTPPYCGPMTT